MDSLGLDRFLDQGKHQRRHRHINIIPYLAPRSSGGLFDVPDQLVSLQYLPTQKLSVVLVKMFHTTWEAHLLITPAVAPATPTLNDEEGTELNYKCLTCMARQHSSLSEAG